MEDLLSISQDVSMWNMLLQSDFVIKCTLCILLLFSVHSWSIIFSKCRDFVLHYKYILYITQCLNSSNNSVSQLYDDLKKTDSHFSVALSSGITTCRQEKEFLQLKGKEYTSEAVHNTRVSLENSVCNILSALQNKMHHLAIIGSSSPFIGLFGTVWGIMNSFQSIASSQTTTLSVVAPSIAEALFATGVGLFVAIPAYIAYNFFSNKLRELSSSYERIIEDLGASLIKELY